MGKCLSVNLVNFWICCNSFHSEQISEWIQVDPMSRFRATSLERFSNHVKSGSFKVCNTEMVHRIEIFIQNEENYNISKN